MDELNPYKSPREEGRKLPARTPFYELPTIKQLPYYVVIYAIAFALIAALAYFS